MSNAIGNRVLLEAAKDFLDERKYDEAWKIVYSELENAPEDPLVLLLVAAILEKKDQVPIAYQFAKLCTQMAPDKEAAWTNLGRCADHLWLMDEAQYCYWKAYGLATRDEHKASILNNLSAVKTQLGKYHDAEVFCQKAVELNPNNHKADHNYGLCLLARGAWKEGWRRYSVSVGSPTRRLYQYAGEPIYNGTKNSAVVVYGEQGIGDEIMFASMVPDLLRDSKRVILDCDKRLAGLYRRSFPAAKVYGTRSEKIVDWDEEDRKPDFSVSAAELGKFYRNDDKDFPGVPYLKPDPDRVLQWRALFDTYNAPVIGLAWSGGVKQTGAHLRKAALEDFLPLMKIFPHATWVNLQYTDARDEIEDFYDAHGIDVLHFPRATLTNDYDDTAGLVAALDRVICVPTSVAHLAGSMGIPCDVIANAEISWAFHRDVMPWYNSLRVFRKTEKETWAQAIGRYANETSAIQMGAHREGNRASQVAAI